MDEITQLKSDIYEPVLYEGTLIEGAATSIDYANFYKLGHVCFYSVYIRGMTKTSGTLNVIQMPEEVWPIYQYWCSPCPNSISGYIAISTSGILAINAIMSNQNAYMSGMYITAK